MCNEADLIKELKVKEPQDGSHLNTIEFILRFEKEKFDSDIMVLPFSKDNGELVGMIYWDFQKISDKVLHNKIKAHGIRGK
eukprot:g40690.t1